MQRSFFETGYWPLDTSMAIWLIRAGKVGEYEQKFLEEKRVYLTWHGLNGDLKKMQERSELFERLQQLYPDDKPKRLQNWTSQIWPFAHEIQPGDLVVTPLKRQPAVYIGQVTTDYRNEAKGPNPFFHWRSVNWIGEAIPRSKFGHDLLHTFGAFTTICRIKRNDAEARINAMRASGWKPDPALNGIASGTQDATDEAAEAVDLEELGRDQIARVIRAKFAGHGLARLVNAILKAQGYTTYLSPEGTDGGIDILAGAAALGFGSPRICVQVKSQESPVGRPEVDQLMGTLDHVKADAGLFVAWGGFKANVYKELATRFFRVRLWTQKELMEQLFANYDRLDEDLRAELPLKRVWTVTDPEEE